MFPAPPVLRFARAGHAIAGLVCLVIVVSFQLQLEMAWMLPPLMLLAFVTFATWSLRCADDTRCVPTPLTLTRRKVRCTPVVPGVAATPLSTPRTVLVPKLVVGRARKSVV